MWALALLGAYQAFELGQHGLFHAAGLNRAETRFARPLAGGFARHESIEVRPFGVAEGAESALQPFALLDPEVGHRAGIVRLTAPTAPSWR